MRTLFGLVLVVAMLVAAAPVAADAPNFPDFTPMEAGPEGVAVDKVGNVYVSVGLAASNTTEVWKFAPDGEGHVLATLPGPSPAGMAVPANGKYVYLAMQFGGVFKIDMSGKYTLVPGTDAIVLPNSLAFDKKGNLYVTETFSFDVDDGLSYYPGCDFTGIPDGPPFNGWFGRGGIWMVPKNGTAQLLARDDLLTGVCSPAPIPYPIGANGIALRHGKLIVANTEKALLLEIPVLRRGGLGTISIIADLSGEALFGATMIDGIALDVHGNIYAAIVTGSTILRVSPDGSDVAVVATPEDGLDFPASLAFGTGKGERKSVFVTNLAFIVPEGFAGPGLAKIDVGRPGMPLP